MLKYPCRRPADPGRGGHPLPAADHRPGRRDRPGRPGDHLPRPDDGSVRGWWGGDHRGPSRVRSVWTNGRSCVTVGACDLPAGVFPEMPPAGPDRGRTQTRPFGHLRPGPVSGVARSLLQRGHDHRFHRVGGDRRWPSRTRIVAQPVQAILDEPAPPLTNRRLGHPFLRGDTLSGQALCTPQHDPVPQCQRLRTLRSPRPPHQPLSLPIGQRQLDLRSHSSRHVKVQDLTHELTARDTSRACGTARRSPDRSGMPAHRGSAVRPPRRARWRRPGRHR